MRNIRLVVVCCTIILLAMGSTIALAKAELVNIRVTDAEVRDVLTALAAVGKVNLVIDETVTGKVTLNLENVPFYDAFNLVVKAKGLAFERLDHAIIVSTPEKLRQSEQSVCVVKLKYALAVDMKKNLQHVFPENPLAIDEAMNAIIYSASQKQQEKMAAALALLDVPCRQVSLEAKVVAINKTASNDIGIEWSWDATPTYPQREGAGMTLGSDGKPSGIVMPGKVIRKNAKGVIQYGRNPEGYPYEFYYQAKINALVADGKAKVLAKPTITTTDGKQAVIFIGDHIPVVTEKKENGQTIATTEYVDAGIKLTYTPRINEEGLITAAVHTEVSTPSLVPEVKNFRITTRQADTVVRMKDGQTLVIGGLTGSEQSQSHSHIPFLADIPLLGRLFQNSYTSQTDTEIVIFLTARVLQ